MLIKACWLSLRSSEGAFWAFFSIVKSWQKLIVHFSPNNEEVKPVFSDKLFCYSSDEGFEGSPAALPSTPTRKVRYCWKSPTKPSSSVAPYLIEASPIRIQRKKKESQSSPRAQKIDTRCDFISQLAVRNMDIIIQQIFGHCGNRELQKVLFHRFRIH